MSNFWWSIFLFFYILHCYSNTYILKDLGYVSIERIRYVWNDLGRVAKFKFSMYERTKIALCTRIVVALFRNSKRLVPLLTLSLLAIFTVKLYSCSMDLNGTSSRKLELAKISIPLRENCSTVLSKLFVIAQKFQYCNTKFNDTLRWLEFVGSNFSRGS